MTKSFKYMQLDHLIPNKAKGSDCSFYVYGAYNEILPMDNEQQETTMYEKSCI